MAKQRFCGVYAIVNSVTGYAYIGSSVDIVKRFLDHRKALRRRTHHCIHLQRAWIKHGETSFYYGLVEFVQRASLKRAEQAWIDLCPLPYNTNPFASRPPSQAGRSPSAANRAATSARFKSIERTEEWRRRIGDAHRGKTISEAQREALRLRTIADHKNGTGIGSLESKAKRAASLRGRTRPPFSVETRVRMSAAAHARKASAETRAKMSIASRARKHTDAARAKIRAAVTAAWQDGAARSKRIAAIKHAMSKNAGASHVEERTA